MRLLDGIAVKLDMKEYPIDFCNPSSFLHFGLFFVICQVSVVGNLVSSRSLVYMTAVLPAGMSD